MQSSIFEPNRLGIKEFISVLLIPLSPGGASFFEWFKIQTQSLLRILSKIFIHILFGFIVIGLCTGCQVSRSRAELSQWYQPPSQLIHVRGMNLHVRDEGNPKDPMPLVLLHGTSASLHTWDGWVATLIQKNHRVIRFDLPGFGLSDAFPDDDFRIQAYVATLAALLEQLQVTKVVLAGNSFGGQVAWQFAVRYPDRVKSLILIDSAGYPIAFKDLPLGFKFAKLPVLNRLMDVYLPYAIVQKSVENVYGDPSLVTPSLVKRYYELLLHGDNRRSLRLRFLQAPSGENANLIPTIQVPTLILWGGKDRLNPLANAHRFNAEIKGSELVVFPDLGHVPHEENPERTVEKLLNFLSKATHDTLESPR